MTRVKTHSFKGEIYAKIPREVVETLGLTANDEVEFEIIDDEVVLRKPVLKEEEMKVLKKIASLKHYERTKGRIMGLLFEEEPNIFEELLSRGVLFEYEKQGKKLIGIDRKFFPLVVEKTSPLYSELFEKGFLVLEKESEVNALNEELREKEKTDQVIGVRGFDKKYYIITLKKLREIKPKFEKALESEKVLSKLAEELKTSEELCKTILEVMKENGEVIEKKKGIYVKA